MKATLTKEVVQQIQGYLGDCTQKVIARYLGVSEVGLSQNIENEFSKTLEDKVGRRLDSLLYLLECVKKDQTLDPNTIHRLLTLAVFPDKKGWKMDVISAIHQDYDKKVLVEIFQLALSTLRKPVDTVPLANGLYRSIHIHEV